MTAIEWQKLTQPEFDRRVEAFYRVDHPGADSFAVNGRGGDGGIDFHIKKDAELTIVQLKCFPEGFSGGFKKTRRDQIRKSYDTAMKHKPDAWEIVLPATLRMDERLFVLGLGGKARTKVPITIVDLNGLDILASRFPSLTDYFETGVLERNAGTMNQAKALSMDMDQIVAHFEQLDHHLEALDPDWRADLIQQGDTIVRVIRAKHPFAHEVSPINVSFNTVFTEDHAELRKTFETAMRFGTTDRIDLPPDVVSNFRVTGPSFVAHESESVGISLIPAEFSGPTYSLELRFMDDRGISSSHTGSTKRIASASGGVSLRVEFHGAVTIDFLLPAEPEASGAMTVALDFADVDPHSVVAGTDLVHDLERAGRIEMHIDGERLCSVEFPQSPGQSFEADRESIEFLRSAAADLDIVQRHTHQHFKIPSEVTGLDRATLRFFRLLIEGNCVVLPNMHSLTLTLNGNFDEGLKAMLNGGLVQLFSTHDEFPWKIFGRELRLGAFNMIAPQVEAVDGTDAIAALEAGKGAGRDLTMRSARGLGFWFMLERHWPTDENTQIRPVSWELNGIEDPPDVKMYAEGATLQVST